MTTSTAFAASERSADRWENEGGPAHSLETQARDELQS
jgi:hypothetical protein